MSEKEILVIKKAVNPLVADALSYTIKNDATMTGAVELLSQLNKIGDRIEEEKQKTLKPANEVVKAIRAQWKPIETMYESGISALRSKMSEWQTEKQNKADQEAQKIAARVGDGKGKLKAETAMAKIDELETPAQNISTESGAVKFRPVQELVIEDIKKIPREFLIPDEPRIKEALKSGSTVPGAKLITKQIPVNFR